MPCIATATITSGEEDLVGQRICLLVTKIYNEYAQTQVQLAHQKVFKKCGEGQPQQSALMLYCFEVLHS